MKILNEILDNAQSEFGLSKEEQAAKKVASRLFFADKQLPSIQPEIPSPSTQYNTEQK